MASIPTARTALLGPGGMPPMATPVAPVAPRVVNGFEILNSLPGVFIAEDIQLLQMLTGCEMENKFEIFALDPATRRPVGERLFRARESSDCFQRQCCGSLRAFNMDIATCDPLRTHFMHLERPFKCTCACLNRSVIYCQSAAREDLGEIYNPFACCDMNLEVRAPTLKREGGVNPLPLIAQEGKSGVWYQIKGSCCQPGVFCKAPCGPCKSIVFNIYGPDGTGPILGEITKTWSGCAKEAFTQADNFTCIFPAGATAYQKATLISAVMLIDFLYFEKRKNRDQNNGN